MKAGRNDPCPCGSGKKFKKCCQDQFEGCPDVRPLPASGNKPTVVEANQLAFLFNAGHLVEAENSARELLKRYPDSGFVWKALGACLQMQGKEATPALQKAANLLPEDAEAHSNLGVALNDLGQLDNAVASYMRALQIKPEYAEAHSNLGSALKGLGQLDNAMASYRRALQINPDYATAHNNLGAALRNLGQLDNAVESYMRALEIKPDYAEAHSSLGSVLTDLGQLDNAAESCRRALQFKPDYAVAHCNLGLALLAAGRLREGWQKYEYRWEGGMPKLPHPVTTLPQWTGQNIHPGERMLILEEQGMGDKLQFSRYLKLAAERFPDGVSFSVCSPLLSLFRRSFPEVDMLEVTPSDQSDWQWYSPLMSLPLAFNTTLETIPGQTPYLVPDPIKVAHWEARIATLDLPATVRKIGVAWKPGTFIKTAASRSVALQQLAKLFDLPDCAWISLQKEPDSTSAQWVSSGKLIDWTDALIDFDDTAALMANLDLVISVDTSVAHLAGALGKSIWLFNRHASEWRWMRDREDSPWYPSMRIFTQTTAGDWDEVVNRMASALNELGS